MKEHAADVFAEQREAQLGLVEEQGGASLNALLRDAGIADAAQDLTNAQARYLLSFHSLDAIRARIAQADRETSITGTSRADVSQMSLAFA